MTARSAAEDFLKNFPATKHKHCGIIDDKGYRNGAGCQRWRNKHFFQKYSGQFLYNNLHHKGYYLVDQKGDQLYFDGLFYANKLEGYGQVVYSDGKIFEGLFKQHLRFGPGVLTYPDSSQDVGFWQGFQLMKISQTVCPDSIPRLARTDQGSARLLKFRSLVSVEPKRGDVAKEILINLGANDEVLAESDLMYNLQIRNSGSLFFNKKLYNDNFTEEDCSIEVELTQAEFEQELDSLEKASSQERSLNVHLFKNEENCACFDQNKDRFAQLCNQLREVEAKLKIIVPKRTALEKKVQHCKICCALTKSDSSKDMIRYDKLQSVAILNIFHESSTTPNYSENILNNIDFIDQDEKDTDNFPDVNTDLRSSSHQFGILLPSRDTIATIGEDNYPSLTKTSKTDLYSSQKINKCECEESTIKDIKSMKDKLEALAQEEAFYSAVQKSIKHKLDAEYCRIQKLSKSQTKFVKKISITHLLAWNNERFWIEVLQHSFRHRMTETNVSFKVFDLLGGRRNNFKKPGIYEGACKQFLEECHRGNETAAIGLMSNFQINPDLCDSRGNTGIMLAAVDNKVNIIKLLAGFGGKIDFINDEGLTPLSMCLLKYLAFHLRISDWEKAFLEEPTFTKEDLLYIQNWSLKSCSDLQISWDDCLEKLQMKTKKVNEEHVIEDDGDETFEDLMETTESQMLKEIFDEDKVQLFVLSTDFVRVEVVKKNKVKKKKKKSKKRHKKRKTVTAKKTKTSSKKSSKKKSKIKNTKPVKETLTNEIVVDKKEEFITNQLNIIKQTISVLLRCGSNPNIGEVPMKVLYLSLFTNDCDLLLNLLENKADPNIQCTEFNLTCLHILSSIREPTEKTVTMCKILLDFKADVNLKTSADHWSDINPEIVGGVVDNLVTNCGKNVLHIVSLREDFPIGNLSTIFAALAEVFALNGCKTDELYLGHTPLSLAVLRGNLNVVEALFRTKCVDPYCVLGNGMGNALTILFLRRFDRVVPKAALEIVDLFLKYNFNPLHAVGEFENVLSFIENENNQSINVKDVKSKGKKGKKGKPKKKKKKKSKRGKKSDKEPNLEDYLKVATRNFLFRNNQSRAVENLYILITENIFADPLIKNWAKLVEFEKVLDCLKMLFQFGIIETERFSHDVIYDMMDFIKFQQDSEKLDIADFKDKLKSCSFCNVNNDAASCQVYLPMPEVDRDLAKYEVCFQCFKVGKHLQLCPRCELIYFCSEECHILNNKNCQFHKCNFLFDNKLKNVNKTEILRNLATIAKNERETIFQLKILEDKLATMKFVPALMAKKADKLKKYLLKLTEKKEKFALENNLLYHQTSNLRNPITSDSDQTVIKPGINDGNVLSGSSVTFISGPRRLSNFPKQEVSVHKSLQAANTCSSHKEYKPRMVMVKSVELAKNKNFKSGDQRSLSVTNAVLSAEVKDILAVSSKKPVTKDYYLELLSKIFADFNLPLMLLPYACFKDGQVYYSMSDSAYLGKSFRKLALPYS